MTQKELKYQVALGAVDFAKIRGIFLRGAIG